MTGVVSYAEDGSRRLLVGGRKARIEWSATPVSVWCACVESIRLTALNLQRPSHLQYPNTLAQKVVHHGRVGHRHASLPNENKVEFPILERKRKLEQIMSNKRKVNAGQSWLYRHQVHSRKLCIDDSSLLEHV